MLTFMTPALPEDLFRIGLTFKLCLLCMGGLLTCQASNEQVCFSAAPSVHLILGKFYGPSMLLCKERARCLRLRSSQWHADAAFCVPQNWFPGGRIKNSTFGRRFIIVSIIIFPALAIALGVPGKSSDIVTATGGALAPLTPSSVGCLYIAISPCQDHDPSAIDHAISLA